MYKAHKFSDESGNVAITFALGMAVIVGFSAIAIDLSDFYLRKRKLQSATDLAAISAAANIGNAQAAALATLALNGFPASSLRDVTLGVYAADPTVQPGARFTPQGASGANAVHLKTQIEEPMIFGGVLRMLTGVTQGGGTGGGTAGTQGAPGPTGSSTTLGSAGASTTSFDTVAIASSAIGAQNDVASFAIGSRLLRVDGGLLNSVLGALLGTNISLTVMDYNSLANVNIDMFAFSNALATRASLTAVTYNTLANGSFKTSDGLGAVLDAAQANPNNSNTALAALTKLASAAPNSSFNLAPIISYGPYGNRSVGSPAPISASATALDVVSAIVQVANGRHQIETAVNASVPGIVSASLKLSIGERPVGTSFVAIGAAGSSVHTAQTRLLLTVQLLPIGQSSVVNLPIYIEIASGTAQLSAIQCTGGNPSSSTVTLGVTPAVVDAWIGNVSNADFVNFTSAPNPGPATLLTVPYIATVSGRAHATITNLSATSVMFDYNDIQALTKKTTTTTDFTSSLLSKLIGDAKLTVSALGLSLGLPIGLDQVVASTLAAATNPVDQLLSGVLQTLGVGIGQADTWVSGVNCGTAVLVN